MSIVVHYTNDIRNLNWDQLQVDFVILLITSLYRVWIPDTSVSPNILFIIATISIIILIKIRPTVTLRKESFSTEPLLEGKQSRRNLLESLLKDETKNLDLFYSLGTILLFLLLLMGIFNIVMIFSPPSLDLYVIEFFRFQAIISILYHLRTIQKINHIRLST